MWIDDPIEPKKVTDTPKDMRDSPGLVQRYSKGGPVSNAAWHQNKLTRVYRNAIEFGGGSLTVGGGYLTTYGLVAGALLTWYASALMPGVLSAIAKDGGFWGYFSLVLGLCGPFCVALIGLYAEFFGPSEAPIYFDRARRKVYYVYRAKGRRFLFFGPTRIEARVTDWDLVDAEHRASLGGSTATVSMSHRLVFVMRASASDASVVGSYTIEKLEFPEALWEYIRRYMDEGAPPLMAGEAPPPKGVARNHSLMDVFRERKARYWSDWRSKPEVMLWQLPLLPVFALYMLVNQLAKWSSVKVVWPPEVQPALGVPITEADVEADPTHSLRAGAQQKDAPDAPYRPQPKPDRGKR